MVLRPLEFRDCLTDSPWFRQNLHEHELSLERSYKSIKNLEQQCRELISYAQKLSRAQRTFAQSLKDFKFENIGTNQTDEERILSGCLKEFGTFINQVEDQRDRILDEAEKNYIEPLRTFRLNRIALALQDEKKKFEKASVRFYNSLEKHLHMSTNRKNNDFKEADASLEMEQRAFYQASLDYVFVLQSVQERMKFEFVETLSSFLYSWLSFYHVGHMMHEDFKPYLDDIQSKVQKARDSFNATQQEAEELKAKMLHVRSAYSASSPEASGTQSTVKQGYLFLLERKRSVINSWTKYFCIYQKETGLFTMIPYSQTSKQQDVKGTIAQSTTVRLVSCTRRASDSIDKRFCFDLTVDRSDEKLTFQALSEEDRKSWIDAMDGKEPVYSPSNAAAPSFPVDVSLDKRGFAFVQKCISTIEERGLDEQGLYRNCGVNSKVQRLLQIGLDDSRYGKFELIDEKEWEIRTITSAIKMYLRNLSEPLMTFDLHNKFINAAKEETLVQRVNHVHYLVHQLPESNFKLLQMLIQHLKRVADRSSVNLMTMANLGVCFGPTLLKPQEETLAAIMDIKFCNVIVEILIRFYDQIFTTLPQGAVIPRPPKPAKSSSLATTSSPCMRPPGSPSKGPSCSAPLNNGGDYSGAESHLLPSQRSSRLQASSASGSGSPPSAWANPIYGSSTMYNSRTNSARPAGIYSSTGDLLGTDALKTNSSCDSLNSVSSVNTNSVADIAVANSGTTSPNLSQLSTHKMTVSYAQPYNSELTQAQGICLPLASILNPPANMQPRRVRTLYECVAGHETELSFLPRQIITNVYESKEPGWLVGTLNGKTGLIPENYVEPLP